MKKDRALAYALFDVALLIVVTTALRLIWELVIGAGFNLISFAAVLFFGGIYSFGAIRLGARPFRYLSDLKRPLSEGLRENPGARPIKREIDASPPSKAR